MFNNNLGNLIKASYLPQKEAVSFLEKKKPVKLDEELSSMESKVFVNEKNTPMILHRGTTRISDLYDDALIAVGLQNFSPRLKSAKELNKKVESKYGKKLIIMVIH